MSKEKIKDIIYLIIAILLSILAIRFMIWALPIILVVVLAYTIYRYLSVKRSEGESANKKEKNIKVIHDLDDEK